MKFKTNAKCGGCVAAITSALAPIVEKSKISFDLSSPDRVMTIDEEVSPAMAQSIIETVKKAGFVAEAL